MSDEHMSHEHMDDKELEAVLREWTQDAPAGRPDRSRVVGGVIGRLGSARRRRRRWWPFRSSFVRKPGEPRAIGKTDDKPDAIPAMDGRSPTFIGRTQTMFSPAKAVTAGALVFAIGGVLLVAQPFDQQGSTPPGATEDGAIDPCTTPIRYVSGHIVWGDEERGTAVTETERGYHARGQVYVNTIDLGDDRLDGRATSNLDWDISGSRTGNDSVHRGTMRIENEAGAWEGPWPGIGQYTTLKSVAFLTGSGAYDGLSAMLFQVSSDTTGAVIEGSIYPTDIAFCDFG